MKECNCNRGPEMGKKVIGCPPKVININHPAEPVLFHRVDVPAAMGDDITYPPENGLYKNVLLVYEANGHIYLYNSDGIPTSLTVNTSKIEEELEDLGIRLDQESAERLETDIALREDIDEVAQDLEDFKNSPDVVDIVATYVDLQSYDTSELGDKDVIRVLTDETHDNESSYYRWDKTAETWTFIGATGPYYTKNEVDAIVDAAKGKAKVLSSADYNWNSVSHDTTEPYDSVALWLLDPGLYVFPSGVNGYIGEKDNIWYVAESSKLYQITPLGTYSKMVICWEEKHTAYSSPMEVAVVYGVIPSSGNIAHFTHIGAPISDISPAQTSVRTDIPLAASVGYTLNNMIGDLSTLTTTNKLSTVAAINEVNSNVGKAKVLSSADYNWNSTSQSTTTPYDSVALWLMPKGAYYIPSGVTTYITKTMTASDTIALVWKDSVFTGVLNLLAPWTAPTNAHGSFGHFYSVNASGTQVDEMVLGIEDNLSSTYNARALSANQGRILNTNIGDLSTLTTTNKSSTVAAINEVNSSVGKAKELTAEDYDWPIANPDGVAVWALSPGFYHAARGVKMYWTSASQGINIAPYEFIIAEQGNSGDKAIFVLPDSLYTTRADGTVLLDTVYLKSSQVVDSLTSTAASLPLSANQGKVLDEKITAINSATSYSAAEVDTGTTWLDGSKIYKKTINVGALPDTATFTVPHGITGLNKIIKAEGCAYDTTLNLAITTGTTLASGSSVLIVASSTHVGWGTTADYSQYTESYVTLYYTKNS